MPNGGRINIGSSGNYNSADASSPQVVQIVSPNGLEKYEQGQTVSIAVHSAGLATRQPLLYLNAGQSVVANWLSSSAYTTVGNVTNNNTELSSVAIDRSGVSDPAPESVYRSYVYNNGVGSKVSMKLPMADGNYAVRLHFIEGSVTTVGARRFDIKVNGVTVRAGYDILAAAGARYKAVAEEFFQLVG